jgi:hypothetical protein
VVTVRHRLMAAAGTVLVLDAVAGDTFGVLRRMLLVDRQGVLIDVVLMRVVEMPVVQVVEMVAVAHRDMPATGTVNMGMILMRITGHSCNIRPSAGRTK